VNLIESRISKNKRKRGRFIPFLLASILFHLLLFFVISPYLLSHIGQQVNPKEKSTPIEITDLPVPKEKETQPPKEATRLAERSHQAPEEKTKDEFTRRGSVSSVPQQPRHRAQQPQRSERVKSERIQRAEEQPKKEKSPQVASIPKEIENNLKPPKEKSEGAKLPNITKEQLFSSSASPFSRGGGGPQEFEGSGDLNKKEDTVDLNTVEFRYFSYFAKLKEKIEQVWNYPETSRLNGEQGNLFLIFTIRRDGYLEDVKLITPSGYVRLDDEAIRAIRVASPFSPFPKSWGGLERLNVKAEFRYEMRYGWTVR
jgi:periplasmic protein TonB